jgi:hypothetical protein
VKQMASVLRTVFVRSTRKTTLSAKGHMYG